MATGTAQPHRPPVQPKVLVVEDEQRLRELLLRVLPGWGFEVAAARSAEEGMRLAIADPPDIAVLDLNLPGDDGLTLFSKMRERWPNIQGIVQTGFASVDAARQAIHLEVVEFLTKPASLGDLERALARAVRKLTSTTPVVPKEALADDDDPAGGIPTDAPAGAAGKTLEEVERQHILATLARCNGNRTAAAVALGISRRTLYYKLEEYEKA